MSTSDVEQREREEEEIFQGQEVFEVEPIGSEEMNIFTSLLEENTGAKIRWFCEVSSYGEVRFVIVALGDLDRVRIALATTFQPLIEELVRHARLKRMFSGMNPNDPQIQ